MIHLLLLLLACCSYVQAATYYISQSAGSDSNTAAQVQSKSTPWAHLPGMPTCASNCASFTPQAGDSFILKGGDTWTATDLGMEWLAHGTSGSKIYIGVDKTWYTGTSWTRPIFTCGGTSCASGTNQFFISGDYVILDNIEFTGLYKAAGGGSTNSVLSTGIYNEVKNCYFHGWSHSASSTDNGSSFAISFHLGYDITGSSAHDNVIDGEDTAQDSFNGINNGYTVYNNVIRYVVSGMLGNFNEVYGNLVERNVTSPTGDHCNLIFMFHPASGTSLTAYNNVVRNAGCPGGMAFWLNGNAGCAGCTTYAYNNVIYGANQGITIGAHPVSGNTGTYYLYNNTIEAGGSSCFGNGEASPRSTAHYASNHCINATTLCVGTGTTCVDDGGNLSQSTVQANAAGYTSSQTYAYSPTAASSPTAGIGSNLTSSCSGSVADLCSDTLYPTYDAVNHMVVMRTRIARPAEGNWTAGAYQYYGSTILTGTFSGTIK